MKLNFSADFSNVLVVGIILIPTGSCTSAKVNVDTTFLVSDLFLIPATCTIFQITHPQKRKHIFADEG